jgi:hypothetical protein
VNLELFLSHSLFLCLCLCLLSQLSICFSSVSCISLSTYISLSFFFLVTINWAVFLSAAYIVQPQSVIKSVKTGGHEHKLQKLSATMKLIFFSNCFFYVFFHRDENLAHTITIPLVYQKCAILLVSTICSV